MKNVITKQGLDRLKKELDYLKKIRRREVANQIREAQEWGDYSENSELDEARQEQAIVEAKIQELSFLVKNSQIINESSKEIVEPGCQVVLLSGEEKFEYTIVGSAETDPANGKISTDSPLGMALAGRTRGEKISLDTISGPAEYIIQEIR